MVLRAFASVVVMTGLTAGCLDRVDVPRQGIPATPDDPTGDPGSPDDPTGDPGSPDDPTGDPGSPDDPTGDPGNPDDPSDPGHPDDPGTARAWCVPTALAHTPSVQLPEVPPEALDRVCALEEETTETTYNDTVTSNTYVWEGDDLFVELGQGGRNLLQLTFDPDGHRVQALYGEARGDHAFAPWDDVSRFRWDDNGELVELATLRGDSVHVDLTQRWEGGRLVERFEARQGTDESGGLVLADVHTRWRYAGDLLEGATSTWLGHEWDVAWRYDALGRPVSVTRTRDGEVVERLGWDFDAEGRLARRTVLRDRSAAYQDGFDGAALDSLAAASVMDWMGDPWADAVPRETEAGCLLVPTSNDYGYPAADAEYELGMPRDERPSGIGFAYGADTYGWNYGDLSWYSHAGVAGLLPDARGFAHVESELRYEAGRMVEETVTSPDGPIAQTHRLRTFDDGVLVVDRLDVSLVLVDSATDTESHLGFGRELRFDWDRKGKPYRLVQRELHDDALGLLEWQSWTRDLQGRWLSHSIAGPMVYGTVAAIPLYAGAWTAACGEGCSLEDQRLKMYYARTLDAAGRTVERRTMRPDELGGLQPEQTERWTYDEAGRVTEASTSYGYVQSYQYDDAGHLLREAWDYDGNGDPDGWIATSWDARGRWTEQATWSEGTLRQRVTRSFACE